MPQVNKKEQNEKFATLLLEMLDTQKQIIEKLERIEKAGGLKSVDADVWNRL